jgi:hypothetical protein
MGKQIIEIVDAPVICLTGSEKAGDALLKFYQALGWNGDDYLNPCKIRTTKDVYNRLYGVMCDRCPDPVVVGMLMVNNGPGTDDFVQPEKVHLLEGWTTPVKPKKGGGINEFHQQAL